MMKFRKVFQVRPSQMGCLFRCNRLIEKLEPGIYRFWDWRNELSFLNISTTPFCIISTNQEVLTQDNIALRFSYVAFYRIADIEKVIQNFNIAMALQYQNEPLLTSQIETHLNHICHQTVRQMISTTDSEQLNQKRGEMGDFKTPEMVAEAANLGITLELALLRDITFPKSIQELFAKQLEAKIRAKSDLENARTAVATARALKNASELMRGDDNIRFMQFLETMTKIAANGKHTFVIGDARTERPGDLPQR
jgi:regulator of protease activity HflC (stomatin/prohibitin superfamily)